MAPRILTLFDSGMTAPASGGYIADGMRARWRRGSSPLPYGLVMLHWHEPWASGHHSIGIQ